MTVANNRLVDIHFKITEAGAMLELTDADQPISFVQGTGSLLPLIEAALVGRCIGEEIELRLLPEQAFGYVNPEFRKVVAIDQLDLGETPLEVGENIVLDEEGPITWTVYKIENGQVYIDGNHPYAGKTLDFWIRIVDIRDAEKAQVSDADASACGPGCCC